MRKVLTRYQVNPNFLCVLYSFGDGPHLSESGSSNASSQITDDGSRSKTALTSQTCRPLISYKTCHIRFDTAKRITGRLIHHGPFDKLEFITTILQVKILIFSYSCTHLDTAFSRSIYWLSAISTCAQQTYRVSATIRIGSTSCCMSCTWIIGDGISDISETISRRR